MVHKERSMTSTLIKKIFSRGKTWTQIRMNLMEALEKVPLCSICGKDKVEIGENICFKCKHCNGNELKIKK